ncbi:MAG TPA: TonB-dependent receptor [Novosphingobium sp.]
MKSLFLVSSVLLVATPAMAAPADDEQITVVATGSRIPLSQTGQSISVVGLDELQRVQGPDLTRVLERLPGVALARSGALGAQTGLFVRGANSDQVLVLIDGVRVADYASPGGNYDLGNLLATNLQSVELLRGSNSVVWGSQAMGGVLAVTTRELHGAEASAEYGAYQTFTGTAAAGIGNDRAALNLDAGYVHSDGFSAKTGSDEADGVRQWQLGAKGRLELAEGLTLRAVGRYANARLGIDLASPSAPDTQFVKQGSGRLGLDYAASGLSLTGGVAFDATARRYDSPAWGPSEYVGGAVRTDLSGRVALPQNLALDFGADSEWSRARSTFDARQSARLSSGHALLGWYTPAASLAAGVRVDDHDRFGTHWTVGANGSVALVDGWRLRGAYGEGFKAPTLYQLYAAFGGNLNLRPETSRSYEAGIEKGDRNGALHIAATWFRRDSRNLIDYTTAYLNVGAARAVGMEVELGARVSERFRAAANYTWLSARDLASGRDLARRPRHTVVLTGDWQTPLPALSLGADLRYVSAAVDYDFLGTPLPIADHLITSLRANLAVSETIQLFARVENLGDARYQTVYGYNTAGRSAYVGARLRM